MSEAKKRVEQVISDLEKDVQLSERLLQLLGKQYSAISLADSDGLSSVNADIEALTEELKSHATTRSENLRYVGLEPDDKGLEKLANKLPPKMKDKIIGLKKNLESNIQGCKAANEKSANQLILSKEMLSKVTGNYQQGYLE